MTPVCVGVTNDWLDCSGATASPRRTVSDVDDSPTKSPMPSRSTSVIRKSLTDTVSIALLGDSRPPGV